MQINEKVKQKMQEYADILREELRWLHENPELSYKEYNTTAFIKERLAQFGIEILDTGLETGCIALLKGKEDGPCIALRGDIDALPIVEES